MYVTDSVYIKILYNYIEHILASFNVSKYCLLKVGAHMSTGPASNRCSESRGVRCVAVVESRGRQKTNIVVVATSSPQLDSSSSVTDTPSVVFLRIFCVTSALNCVQ